jgi:hypothetical protein
MIGDSLVEEMLQKALTLNEAVAWMESNDKKVQDDVIKLIQKKQLLDLGVDETGSVIGYYSAMTEIISGGRKKQGDPYNLKDTGRFFSSMYVKVMMDSIIIDANYEKMEDQDWWSTSILGLTDENLDIYVEKIKENFISYTRRVLGLD